MTCPEPKSAFYTMIASKNWIPRLHRFASCTIQKQQLPLLSFLRWKYSTASSEMIMAFFASPWQWGTVVIRQLVGPAQETPMPCKWMLGSNSQMHWRSIRSHQSPLPWRAPRHPTNRQPATTTNDQRKHQNTTLAATTVNTLPKTWKWQQNRQVLCIWNRFSAHFSCQVIMRNDEKLKGFQLTKLEFFENR